MLWKRGKSGHEKRILSRKDSSCTRQQGNGTRGHEMKLFQNLSKKNMQETFSSSAE